MRKFMRRLRDQLKEFRVAAVKTLSLWPEFLQVVGILSGWGLITFGVASLLWWQLWPISAGLLILSFVGWGHLKNVFGLGLYKLRLIGKAKEARDRG
jgi:hypothetical protein